MKTQSPRWALIVVPYNRIRTVLLPRAESEAKRLQGYVLAKEDEELCRPVTPQDDDAA